MERDTSSTILPLGAPLPRFELMNVDGRKLGHEYLKEGKASLAAFRRNPCPYVKGSQEMLTEIV